jgi:hypothetical protein
LDGGQGEEQPDIMLPFDHEAGAAGVFDDGPVGVLQSDVQTIVNIVIVVPRPMFSFTEWVGLGHRKSPHQFQGAAFLKPGFSLSVSELYTILSCFECGLPKF